MKREILLSLGILFCMNSFAQNIQIEEQQMKEDDDKVFVSFTVAAEKIKSNERLTLTPVIYNGDNSKSLEPIIIVGRNRTITDKRQSAAIVAGIRTTENQRIPYSITVPYESWMGDVSLRVDRKIEGCCGGQLLASHTVFKEKPIRYDVVVPTIEYVQQELSPVEKIDVELPFLAPMAEYSAMKDNMDVMRVEGALIVKFRQGNNTIDPSYQDNAKSLERVCAVLALIDADPNASVGKIVLAGTSSPEGSAKLNDQLAQKRVQALQNYLAAHTRVNIHSVESITIGEDWAGLRNLVEQSDMQYKTEVLKIIDNIPVMRGREKRLMDLKWGRPYNYMLAHFFPKLRNAGYIRIFYESTPNREFEKINQAIELCNNKEYRKTLTRLEDARPTAIVENMRGVCYMMLGEYAKAEATLKNAVQLGSTQAEESLRQLGKLKAVQQ